MMENRKISLIAVTYKKSKALPNLVASLQIQTYRNFELIVVVQDEESRILAENCTAGSNFPVNILRSHSSCVSECRNTGLSVVSPASGVIAFPDDDCRYLKDTLTEVEAYFNKNPECGIILGQHAAAEESIRPGAEDLPVSRFSCFKCGETYVQFYQKSALRETTFNTAIGPGSDSRWPGGEDTDFLLRVMDAGASCRRVPAVKVLHPDANIGAYYQQRIISYGRARMKVLALHRFPLTFKILNILYPLCRIPFESPRYWKFRGAMFYGRLSGFLAGLRDK